MKVTKQQIINFITESIGSMSAVDMEINIKKYGFDDDVPHDVKLQMALWAVGQPGEEARECYNETIVCLDLDEKHKYL
jgi:hypothetical protein